MSIQTRIMISVTTGVAFALASPVVSAQEAAEERRAVPNVPADAPSAIFGTKGQLAISSDAGFELSNTSISDVDGSTTRLILRPAIDYFVVDYLSLGGFLGLEYLSTPGGSTTQFSIGPRVGYNIPFSESFSFWPKLGFSLASTSVEAEDTETPDGVIVPGEEESSTSLQLNIFAPVMFHPVEHFFLGVGPAFDLDLTGDEKATTIAARLTLGGWM